MSIVKMVFIKAIEAVTLVMLLSVSFVVHAESKNSAQYEKCMENVDLGAFKDTQWAACNEQEAKKQDVILNAVYNKLRKQLDTEQKGLLTSAQKAWLKFRGDWCRFDAQVTAPGGDAGYGFCILDITNKQIDSLKGLIE